MHLKHFELLANLDAKRILEMNKRQYHTQARPVLDTRRKGTVPQVPPQNFVNKVMVVPGTRKYPTQAGRRHDKGITAALVVNDGLNSSAMLDQRRMLYGPNVAKK